MGCVTVFGLEVVEGGCGGHGALLLGDLLAWVGCEMAPGVCATCA